LSFQIPPLAIEETHNKEKGQRIKLACRQAGTKFEDKRKKIKEKREAVLLKNGFPIMNVE